MLQILLSMSELTEEGKVLCIHIQDQKAQYIPYDKIYYIEARDKNCMQERNTRRLVLEEL